MSLTTPEGPFLPLVARAHYKRNFLKQVVCELRFPTLFELDSAKPPEAFYLALRKDYPHVTHVITETNVNGMISHANQHVFRSKSLDWTVTLRPSALTIETTKYDCFERLLDRIEFLLKIAAKVIDSDFFTRIGLRYINTMPFDENKLSSLRGWVREGLVQDLIDEDLGVIGEWSGRMAGTAEFGAFLFQHGITNDPNTRQPEYLLDFDMSKDNVELEETVTTIKSLHERQFSMFSWAIGEKAREHLGPSTLEGAR